jgi:hypothetical protein
VPEHLTKREKEGIVIIVVNGRVLVVDYYINCSDCVIC